MTCSRSLSREAEVFAEARSRYDSAQFVDVEYADLVGDPVGTVHGVYDAFGLPWDDGVASAVTEEHRRSREGPRAPRHTYDLADYGLTEEQVRAAF